jgi:hypothetical protein
MDKAASFVVRWRITLIALTLALTLSAVWLATIR